MRARNHLLASIAVSLGVAFSLGSPALAQDPDYELFSQDVGAPTRVVDRLPPSKDRVDAIIDDTTATLWRLSGDRFHNGHHPQTIRILHLITVIDPHFEEAWTDEAWLDWSAGDVGLALGVLREGVAANADSYALYDELGNCYNMWMHRLEDSYPYYLKAADYYDQAPWFVYGSLAHAAEAGGDYVRAAVAWRTAILKADDHVKRDTAAHNLERVIGKIMQRESADRS